VRPEHDAKSQWDARRAVRNRVESVSSCHQLVIGHFPIGHWLKLGLFVVSLVLCSAGITAGAEWWKEPASASPLEQRILDPQGTSGARTRWDEGVFEVKAGATADPRRAYNEAQARGQALRAAYILALRKLAEVVEGVQIDGTTVVRNAMFESSEVRASLRAYIQGARIVREDVTTLADGSIWAEVTVAYPMAGKGGLVAALAPWLVSRPSSFYTGIPGAQTVDRYTGLIVDASGTGFSPALAPRLLAAGDQRVVYGPHTVQLAALEQKGLVGYAASLSDALRSGRVGSAPLIVRAGEAVGARRGDLVLSLRDAERLLAADRTGSFLTQAAVVVVLGKGPADYVKAPGRRHALVIGVGSYPQGGPGAVPPLEFAVRDADALAEMLHRLAGFAPADVTLLREAEATRQRILDALRLLRSQAAEQDVVLVFFSGHGTTGSGPDGRVHYYLVPHDGRLDDLAGTALRDDVVEELVGQIPAKQVVVLLDACFSGRAGQVARVKGVSASATTPNAAGLFVEAAQGRVVISASRADQPSVEDPTTRQGVFTHYLLEALGGAADLDRDGKITVLEAFQYLSAKVREHARQRFQLEQQPVLEVRGMSGEIVLAEKK